MTNTKKSIFLLFVTWTIAICFASFDKRSHMGNLEPPARGASTGSNWRILNRDYSKNQFVLAHPCRLLAPSNLCILLSTFCCACIVARNFRNLFILGAEKQIFIFENCADSIGLWI